MKFYLFANLIKNSKKNKMNYRIVMFKDVGYKEPEDAATKNSKNKQIELLKKGKIFRFN